MDGPGLAEALAELAEIDNELSRVSSYVNLRESVDVTSEENKDLSAAVDRALVEAGNALRFFDLEWIALPEERARELYDAPEVARDRHYLMALRRFAPHTLSEPEERMLAERSPAAVSAWQTLFGRVTSTLEVPFDAGDGARAAHHRPAARPRPRPRPRPAPAGARDALRRPRAARGHARPLLRHAGRRPPGDGPPAQLRLADGADPPAQRAAGRGR